MAIKDFMATDRFEDARALDRPRHYEPYGDFNRRSARRGKRFVWQIVAAASLFALISYVWQSPAEWANKARETITYALSGSTSLPKEETPTLPELDAPSVSTSADAVPTEQALLLPVSGVLTRSFSGLNELGVAAYEGIDIRAESGVAVKAAADGEVLTVQKQDDGGWLVIISHADGVVTHYGELAKVVVKQEQTIAAGEAIGTTGENPVFFGIWRDGEPLDPLACLSIDK